jgi:4-amino-4-deoxy-L-arabinose transferase-like glycosyltransferase
VTAAASARRLPYAFLTAAIVGVGFVARLLAVRLTPGYVPYHDDRSYLLHVLALERTGSYPVFYYGVHQVQTAYRPPGLPYLLAGVHWLFGGALPTDRTVQVVVGTVLVALVGVVARQVWDRRTALVAMTLAALSPALVLFGASVITEPLYATLEVAAIAGALQARRAGARGHVLAWALLAGVLAGLAALTRPEGLLVVPAIALIAWRADWRAALAVVAAAAVAISPWTIRNAEKLHAFVPVSTEAGNTLAGMYNDVAWHKHARWQDPRLSHLYTSVRRANQLSEAGNDSGLRDAALHWVLRHPGYPLYVLAENLPRIAGVAGNSWSADGLRTVSLPTGPAPWLRIGLLLSTVLALAGAATERARRLPLGWWLAGAVLLATAVFINAEQRFAVPLQPWLLLLAAAALVSGAEWTISRARSGTRRSRAAGSRAPASP